MSKSIHQPVAEVTVADFVNGLFAHAPKDAHIALYTALDVGGRLIYPATEWTGAAGDATHLSVAAYGPERTGSGRISRRLTNVAGTCILQLDDIGTKGRAPDLAPSAIIETRPNNATWLYILREPCTDPMRYQQVAKSLAAGGYGDENSVDAVRLFRLPDSKPPNKEHAARLTLWQPDRVFDLDAFCDAFGVPELPRESMKAHNAVPAPIGVTIKDHAFDWLDDNGYLVRAENDGWYLIRCPWAHLHSDQRPFAKYKPATQQDAKQVFHCHHGHGQTEGEWGMPHRTAALLDWIKAQGGRTDIYDVATPEKIAELRQARAKKAQGHGNTRLNMLNLTEDEVLTLEEDIGPDWRERPDETADWINDIRAFEAREAALANLPALHKTPPLPVVPDAILPPLLAGYVDDIHRLTGFDRGACSLATLIIAAGIAGAHHRVMMTGAWSEPSILWGLIIGPPSAAKSPLLKAIVRPVEVIEMRTRAHHAEQVRRAKAQAQSAAAAKRAEEALDGEPRYLVQDTTIEKLGGLLSKDAQGARGILCVRDELAGWLESMDAYKSGKGGDRPAWLTAWSGGYASIDRVKRGELMVRNFGVSLIGAIQPDKLEQVGKGGALADDGLVQRFLPIFMQPTATPTLGSEEGDALAEVQADMGQTFTHMAALPATTWRLSAEAAACMNEFQTLILPLRDTAFYGTGFQEWAGKLMGQFGRLCLVIEMYRSGAAGIRAREGDLWISGGTAMKVKALMLDYMLRAGIHMFEIADGANCHWAAIGNWMLRMDAEGRNHHTVRDVRRTGPRCLRGDAQQIRDMLEPFAGAGWIELGEGWPWADFTITDGLARRWADDAAQAQERFTEVQALIRAENE